MNGYSEVRTNNRGSNSTSLSMSTLLLSALLILLVGFGITSCFDSNTESAPPLLVQKPPLPPTPPTFSCIVEGAWVYDNWTTVEAGGTGILPAEESFVDYLRCKSCHGWDQLGQEGGYIRRTRTMERPNAGFNDSLNTVSRNISTGAFGMHDPISKELVLQKGTGRSWAQGSSAWDGGSAQGIEIGNRHPDFSQAGGLTEQQTTCLVAFLNASDARADKIFSSISLGTNSDTDPLSYTIVATASESEGKTFYEANCKNCHGEPMQDSTAQTNGAPGKGGMIAYLEKDGKASEFMHKMHWGIPATIMLRNAMGNPTSSDVSNVLQYMHSIQVAGLPVAFDDAVITDTDTSIDIDVLLNDRDVKNGALSISRFDALSVQGGTVSKNANETLHYVPPTGYIGDDEFSYTISDADSNESTATVRVTVGNIVAANGKIYYDNNCAICHAAGSDDSTIAFFASDLALQANPLTTDLSIYGGQYKLMGAFGSMPPQTLNELQAYFSSL